MVHDWGEKTLRFLNRAFDSVVELQSAEAAAVAPGAPNFNINCPVAFVGE